ncbi:IS3 family transposase [Pseudomonas sp. PONIH3]|uniref:IS3 family transposase n=1 Tax=Pseudomonas sp. PONIH3 TaxID=1636610 RepID=UPI001319F205
MADKHAALKERINSLYHGNKGRYGYRRITAALGHNGEVVNHKKVQCQWPLILTHFWPIELTHLLTANRRFSASNDSSHLPA